MPERKAQKRFSQDLRFVFGRISPTSASSSDGGRSHSPEFIEIDIIRKVPLRYPVIYFLV